MNPKAKAKYLKKVLPKSYIRYINIKILEHQDKDIQKTETLEYWNDVKKIIENE